MWVIAFVDCEGVVEVAEHEDREVAKAVFDRFKKIHEEAMTRFREFCDSDTYHRRKAAEQSLYDFSQESPIHGLSEQHSDKKLCLFERRTRRIEESTLAPLMQEKR